MTVRKEMVPIAWAKISATFFSNRKCRRAGRAGREVFLYVLCMNAARGSTGSIPLDDLELWHVAEQLQMNEEEARAGISRACSSELIDITNTDTGPRVFIVGWSDEWSRRALTEAERKAAQRSRELARESRDNVTCHDAIVTESRIDPGVTHERRGVESRGVERIGDQRREETEERRGEEKVSRRATRPVLKVEGFGEVIDEFHRLFDEAYGTKPTWGEKAGAQAKRLIKAHGADEVIRRIRILFTEPPSWLEPPYDFGTLAQHFDKLAVPSRGAPSRVPVHQQQMNRQLDRVAEAEREAREPHEFEPQRGSTPHLCILCGEGVLAPLHPISDDVPWA